MAADVIPESKCPRCQVNYKLTDRKHHVYHKREPLLLSCGHAVCEACWGFAQHTCILCQQVTALEKKGPKRRHLYILGGLYSNRRTENVRMNTHFSKMYPQPKDLSKGQCQECCHTKATVLCTTCNSQLCDGCFRKVHLPRTMKAHQAEPLPQGGPWEVMKCPDHPQESFSLLCHTCSSGDIEKYICARCHIMGSHQHHEVIELKYLNSLHVPQMEAALSKVEDVVEALQGQRNRCRVLFDDLNKAQQKAVNETMDVASHLHGLLQLREEEVIIRLHTNANALHLDLVRKDAELEREITEHVEMVKEARAALRGGEDSCHAGKLLAHLRQLLGDAAESDNESTSTSQEEGQQEQQEKEEEDEKYRRLDALDEIAGKITSSFGMTNVMENLSEQFSLPSVSQLLDINKDCFQSSLSRTPEEAISDGRLTPAHLQVLASTPDMLLKPQRSSIFPQNTHRNSIHPLISEREPSLMSKCQSLSTLPLEHQSSHNHSLGPQESFRLLLEPKRDFTLPLEPHKNFALLTGGTIEDQDLIFPNSGKDSHVAPVANDVHGMLSAKVGFVTNRNAKISSPSLIPDTGHDSDSSLKSNSVNGFGKIYRRPQHSMDRLSSLCDPSLPFASSSVPTDTDNDDTLLLGVSDSSSTKDSTIPCAMEDTPLERDTTDFIPSLSGLDSRGARPKVNAAASDTMISSTRKIVPPPLPSSSKGYRTFTSSLLSSTSSRSSIISAKTGLCFVEEEVEVTHIINPSFFYVHVKDSLQKRKTLSKKLYQLAMKSKPLTTTPADGDVYIGQYTEDNKWYRVQVKTVMVEKESALVIYVDYGNKEVLPFARMRPCPAKHRLENQLSLALACGLWELEPARGNDWDMEAIHIFAKLVKGVALQFLLVTYESVNNITKCQVDLRRPWKTVGISNDLPVSIREILVFLDHGVYTNNSPQDMYNKNREESFKRRYFLPEIPFCEMDTEVLLSSITSPHNFSLQLASSSEHLNSLLEALEKTYSDPKIKDCVEWNIYSPKIGMSCVARYSGDEQWQRARVEDLPGHQMVDVKFVDFGNTERLWYHQIYKIKDDFLVLPIQAVPCKLVGINPVGGNWTEKDTQRMAELCDVPKLKAVFLTREGEVCSVRLTVSNDGEDLDVVQLMVEDGIAVPLASCDINSHKLKRRIHKEIDKTDTPSKPSSSQPNLHLHTGETRHEVARLEVLKPFVYLHVLLEDAIPDLHLFQEQLEKTLQSEASGDTFVGSVGDDCVAVRRNGQHARARILSMTQEQAEVLLVDCGGIVKVGVANLRPLPEGMGSTTKPFCQMVSLVGILPPAGLKVWPGITLDYFRRQFSSSKKFSIVPKDEPVWNEMLQMKVLPVDLGWLQEVMGGPMEPNKISWVSINNELVSHGLALPVRLSSSSLKDLNLEGGMEVCPTPVSKTSSDIKKGDDTSQPAEKSEDNESETSSTSDIKTTTITAAAVPKGWMLPPPPTHLTFTAKPTYVDSEGHIFLQPKSNAAIIAFIEESQSLLFNGSSPEDHDLSWQPGDPVVAQFHLDKKWYRATVNQLERNGKVNVTFVDYGNPEVVKVNEIRTRLIHTSVPILCYKAVLNNVIPASEDGHWSTTLLDFIHLSLVEKECLVTVVEPPKWGEVLKVPEDGESNSSVSRDVADKEYVLPSSRETEVNLKLLSMGLDVTSFLVDELEACRRLNPPKEEEQRSHDVIIESEESEVSIKVSQSPPTPQLYLPVGEMFCVQVTAIQDPAHVFIMPLASQELTSSLHHKAWSTQRANLKEFEKRITKDAQNLKVVSEPKVGEVYLTQFMDEVWVRAEVEETDATTASVLYIDFGYREKVPKETIRECPLEGRKIAHCASLVRLSGVEPPGGPKAEWEVVAMEAMIACIMDPEKPCFLASVVDHAGGGLVEVELFKMDSVPFTLAYSELVEKGIIALKEKK